MRTHLYRDDQTKDHRGDGRCLECGTPEGNQRHGPLPETPDGDISDRILGEGGDVAA